MEYRKFGADYVVRFDKGEELLESLAALCRREDITLGSLSGIGAVDDATLGVFNTEKFAYESTRYTGDMEIGSCTGSISRKDGEVYLHIHAVLGNPTREFCRAGHLSRAVISLTGEFVLHTIPAVVEREYSPEVGLNLFRFA